MSITEAVKAAIQTALPAAVAGELSEYLKLAEKWKTSLDFVNAQNSEKEEIIEKLNANLTETRDKLHKHSALDARLLEIEKRERSLENDTLKIKLEEAERRNTDIKEMAMTAFRNPKVMHTRDHVVPIDRSSGGWVEHYPTRETVTKESV